MPALLADSLSRASSVKVDVVKQPIGIALSDGRFMRIIDKDSRLPITRRVMIPTVRDNQRVVEVDLFQGDTEDLLETEYPGSIAYPDVPEAKAGESKLVVDLVLDAERTLCVVSPEDGRNEEKFVFKTKGHRDRKGEKQAPPPIFNVARHPEA